MYFAILLLLLSRSSGQDYGVEEKKCDVVVFKYKYYDRQILFGGYGKAFNLVMHELTGDLFFSHASRKENLKHRQIMVCNSRKGYCTYVSGIINGYTIAYDQHTDEIFFGGTDGIYKYDFFKHTATLIAASGVSVWDIFIYEQFFYYIVHPTQRLYVARNRKFDDAELVVYTEVDHFHIAKVFKDENIYISNRTGLYRILEHPRNHTVLLNNTEIQVRQITHDADNIVYFATNDGIYKYRKRFKRIMRIPVTSQLYGMTIINVIAPENKLIIIYSDEKNIYRLIPSDDVDCINEYIAKRKKHHVKHTPKNNTLRLSIQLFR